MEDKLNRVRVLIAGDEYTIKGEASSDTISRISEYVNSKITEIGTAATSKERYRLAILAAVNITGELFEARKELFEASDKLDQYTFKAKELSRKIETVIDG
ncbi:MAG: cell division protein ZapA [Fibrobacterota bacterium]